MGKDENFDISQYPASSYLADGCALQWLSNVDDTGRKMEFVLAASPLATRYDSSRRTEKPVLPHYTLPLRYTITYCHGNFPLAHLRELFSS